LTQIAAVVLAAGASTRFGRPKQLADWQGSPLVMHVVSIAQRAGLAPVVVVLGSHAEAVGAALRGAGPDVETVMNWNWERGLSTSIQTALMALEPGVDAAVFLQCDQPLVTPELLRALTGRFRATEAAIVHPVHAGKRFSPALFARQLFPELARLSGDVGGRELIVAHAGEVERVEVADPDALADVDTPEEYERLSEHAIGKRPVRQEGNERALAGGISPEAAVSLLQPIRNLIIDMDGVLWRGDKPLPGLPELFDFLGEREIDFVLATNNSSRLPEQYAAKLRRFGVAVTPEHVLTSAQATAAYLSGIAEPGSRVYPIGGDGVRHALRAEGFVLADDDADYVVVGWDQELTWKKMATAALMIYHGAGFVGTNPDSNYPTERGPVPGNGAQLSMLATATGVSPIVVGKPEPWIYQAAMRRMDARPETTAVIGDRLDTDIAGGVPLGITTILVLSGIASAADVAGSSIKPDLVLSGIVELVQRWRAGG
jgi:4-nitrophenyl phosphatase